MRGDSISQQKSPVGVNEPDGAPITRWQGHDLHIHGAGVNAWCRYHGATATGRAHLQWLEHSHAQDVECLWLAALAACEAVFNQQAGAPLFQLSAPPPLMDLLLTRGAAVEEDGMVTVHAPLFWQQGALWLRGAPVHYPLQPIVRDGKRHPRRAPKPRGELYARRIPWLGQTLTLRALELERDLPLVNRWMNDPQVAFFWQEQGDMAHTRAYLETQLNDAHSLPVIGCFDGHPFGYFEVYWAREDRIAPFYDVHDFDRGWHVLVGEPAFRGRAWFTAWFPSLMHYLFLDDCRTMRIVAEPRADNERLLRNSAKTGFSQIKEFDFPHKRAMLVQLLRERFFGEGLLFPRADHAPEKSGA